MSDESAPLKELRDARLTIKKLERELKQARDLIERNRVSIDAKDNLSRIISQKKSELEKYMGLLLESSPDIIMIFDRDGKLLYCTDVFLRLAGIPGFGFIAGIPYQELWAKFASRELSQKMDALFANIGRSNQAVHFTDTIDFSGEDKIREYSVKVTPMRDEGDNDMGAMALFLDTTDLLAAQRDAERANKAKSDFLALVSHEIRTPMNAIIGVTNMLQAMDLTSEQERYVKSIQSSSNVLLSLINDILDFSKIESGKLELINDFFSLPALLHRLKAIFELLFSDKDLSFSCVFAEDLPTVSFGDEKRVSQVISNLLSNAVKYTEAGGGVLRVRPDGEDFLLVEVEDTGIGIKNEAIPKLFSTFVQLDQARNKKIQGSGLGLAIAQRICLLMEGAITVKSEYDKGSVFTARFKLPRGRLEDLPEEKSAPEVFTAPEARALLVDDIEINLDVAAFALNSFGITPDTANSGREAIEKVRAQRYDIIFMDHMMPEMDGVEAVRIIRGLGGEPARIPILALTANAVEGVRDMFLANGFNGLIPKPLDLTALGEALLRWLPAGLICKPD